MFKKLIFFSCLIYFLCLQYTQVFSQADSTWFHYHIPTSIADNKKVDVAESYNKIISLYSDKIHDTLILRRFAESHADGKARSFNSGLIYHNWAEMEDYLNRVLNTLLPDSLKEKKIFHIYPSSDPSINAFSMADGSILFNVGLFAQLKDESMLAAILAHELSHFLNNDDMDGFVKAAEGDIGVSVFLYDVFNSIKQKSFSREQEKAADDLSFSFMDKSNYDLQGSVDLFDLFIRVSAKSHLHHDRAIWWFGSTHPSDESRKG